MLVLSGWLATRWLWLTPLFVGLAASLAVLVAVGADGIVLCTTDGGFPRK